MNAAQFAKVYGFIIDQCLKGYLFDADRLACEWDTTEEELGLLGLRSVPSPTLNLLIGSECRERFGAEVLRDIPGFTSYSSAPMLCDCAEFNAPCWCDGESWILDLDPWLHPYGLLLPKCDQDGRAIGLWVFRNSRDQKPFLLRSRKMEIAA